MSAKVQVSDESVGCGGRKGERVTPNEPSDRDDGIGEEACPNEREGVLSARETWEGWLGG